MSHPSYPERFTVPDVYVPWDVSFPGYQPTAFTDAGVLAQDSSVVPGGWADGPTPNKEDIERRGSHELLAHQLDWVYDADGRPLNPRGRTGMSERGKLGKWGPNHAGDAVVTRHVRRRGGEANAGAAGADAQEERMVLEFIAIRRKDTGEWALPGGMQDPGEVGMSTLLREFREEAGAVEESERGRFNAMVDELFNDANGRVVYRGYVDDPRNTDHSWMETIAMHFHCPDAMGELLRLKAGDDAAAVMWLEASEENEAYRGLYASHKEIVDKVRLTHDDAMGVGGSAAVPSDPPFSASSTFAAAASAAAAAAGGGVGAGDAGKPGPGAQLVDSILWGMAALLESDQYPLGEPPVSLSDVLDLCSICPAEFKVASIALAALLAEDAGAAGVADARGAGGGAAAPAPTSQRCTVAISARLCPGDIGIATNIFENLRAIAPWQKQLSSLAQALEMVSKHEHSWRFPDDGTCIAPTLPPPECSLQMNQPAIIALRTLAFVDKPPALLRPEHIASLRRRTFEGGRCSLKPRAIVLVGAPGSGKSSSLTAAMDLTRQTGAGGAAGVGMVGGGPPPEHYVYIDPDLWISELCDNNNVYRNVANFTNHETFLSAVSQRRHIVFDGTGKSLLNTCGRIIGRLRQADYHVTMLIVLASFERCMARISARREQTNRGVPEGVVRAAFSELQRSVPVYLSPAEAAADAVLLFDNDIEQGAGSGGGSASLVASLTPQSSGADREEALRMAALRLRMD